MNEKERLGSLWVNESKKGVRYMKGVITIGGKDTKIVLFRNKTKKNENSPDFSIFESVPFQKSAPNTEQTARKVFQDDIL